jgi:hypothetical protein
LAQTLASQAHRGAPGKGELSRPPISDSNHTRIRGIDYHKANKSVNISAGEAGFTSLAVELPKYAESVQGNPFARLTLLLNIDLKTSIIGVSQ